MQSSVKLVNIFAMPASAGIMVLASPIMIGLYDRSAQIAADVLIFLGAASFFVCLQLVTTAILQANGNERLPMLSIIAGGVTKIVLSYVLVGNPKIGILGSPISSLACFIVICAMNIVFTMIKVKDRPKFGGVFVKPLLCTAAMSAVAYSVYLLVHKVGSGIIGSGRFAVIVFLAATVVIALIVYLILIIRTRTITMDDMKLVPKGEKLAKILRIR